MGFSFDGLQQGISRLLMSSLWRLRDCLPPLPRPSFLRNQDLKPRQPISLLFSSEGLMVDRLRLFTSSCSLVSVIVEVDRILRPQGTFIVNDGMEKIGEIEKMMESLKWNVRMTHSRYGEGVISVQKSWWRPTEVETITSAIESERELV
ncbi:unnamed protein product [Brassica rapa subsp. narinosa]|uniref:Methyltransferase n=1 Tax=Brassica napus TaxID=3708 RepID=A0A816P9X8_BRANA|nr:unnamed protein product [Brassica napus]